MLLGERERERKEIARNRVWLFLLLPLLLLLHKLQRSQVLAGQVQLREGGEEKDEEEEKVSRTTSTSKLSPFAAFLG